MYLEKEYKSLGNFIQKNIQNNTIYFEDIDVLFHEHGVGKPLPTDKYKLNTFLHIRAEHIMALICFLLRQRTGINLYMKSQSLVPIYKLIAPHLNRVELEEINKQLNQDQINELINCFISKLGLKDLKPNPGYVLSLGAIKIGSSNPQKDIRPLIFTLRNIMVQYMFKI